MILNVYDFFFSLNSKYQGFSGYLVLKNYLNTKSTHFNFRALVWAQWSVVQKYINFPKFLEIYKFSPHSSPFLYNKLSITTFFQNTPKKHSNSFSRGKRAFVWKEQNSVVCSRINVLSAFSSEIKGLTLQELLILKRFWSPNHALSYLY